MLFEPDRHEVLCDVAWDAAEAHEAIRAIVRDIEQHRLPEGQWPLHPLDDEGDTPATGFKTLYLGSAGVLWALWALQRDGAVVLDTVDPVAAIEPTYAAYLQDPDTGSVLPSYFLGEAGILLVLWRLTGSSEAADKLVASVKSNIANPTNEALWGAPGTMLAAWHLWQATSEERWRDLFLANVEQVWRTWIFDEPAQCHLWTQDMYGKVVQYLGAGHGFAGNVYPLLKGASLLDTSRREALYERCIATLQATAEFDDGGAVNWRPGTFAVRPGRPRMLMQWCHGAPGVVTALADFPPQRFPAIDALLIGAGHAIWRAGPLVKGYGLCHGTAGNGYAFLKLYQRSGDPLWLDRARSFAVHAIAQRDRQRQQYGQGRHTLWTGDAGLAVYLWHCLRGTAGLPALDMLQ
jgi:Lanthionine synthetase C-like protein